MDYVKKSIDERALHKREHDSRVNERQTQTTMEKINEQELEAHYSYMAKWFQRGSHLKKETRSTSSHWERNKDAKSHKTTKRYMPVEKSSASKKPERLIPKGHRFSYKKTTTVLEKTRTPRSCLSVGHPNMLELFKTVGLRYPSYAAGKKLWVLCQDDLQVSLHIDNMVAGSSAENNTSGPASFFIKRLSGFHNVQTSEFMTTAMNCLVLSGFQELFLKQKDS
ncbi:hypothetical protein Tco_0044705 [Tanacetum coccineum]